jgi:hypothetical protein
MNRITLFRIFTALVLVGAMLALGIFAYQAGLARGMAAELPAPENGQVMPYYPYFGLPYRYPLFGGFGFLGCLIPLFFFFLFFAALRALFWRGRWGMRHWGARGWDPDQPGQNVPPMFAEWHRRAHETPGAGEPKQDE